MMDIIQLFLDNVDVIIYVFVLTGAVKKLGLLEGRGLTIAALVLSIVIMVAEALAIGPVPNAYTDWFNLVAAALGIGAVTTFGYDLLSARIEAVMLKVLDEEFPEEEAAG